MSFTCLNGFELSVSTVSIASEIILFVYYTPVFTTAFAVTFVASVRIDCPSEDTTSPHTSATASPAKSAMASVATVAPISTSSPKCLKINQPISSTARRAKHVELLI